MQYTKTKYYDTGSETHTYELRVPNDDTWGMFTSAGNRSITKKAQGLLRKLESQDKTSQHTKSLLAFLRSYRSMERTESYGEAGDTDVREQVWDFFKKACLCVRVDADSLWEASEGYPKRRDA